MTERFVWDEYYNLYRKNVIAPTPIIPLSWWQWFIRRTPLRVTQSSWLSRAGQLIRPHQAMNIAYLFISEQGDISPTGCLALKSAMKVAEGIADTLEVV